MDPSELGQENQWRNCPTEVYVSPFYSSQAPFHAILVKWLWIEGLESLGINPS